MTWQKSKSITTYEEAREAAFAYLARRDHFRAELVSKLTARGADASLAQQLGAELIERGYLDDSKTAEIWIRSRKRKYGPARIREELRAKEVDSDLIATALARFYDEEEEKQILQKLLEQDLARYPSSPDEKERNRLLTRYAQRGFSPRLILKTLNANTRQT
ncbi:MAG: recombination regulator RecX [Clostridiales bacterium]|jgi:regulatory protein|nr:recombination regulator RecX [Clostridiales bacterium]MDR2711680.1 recombination regulator RecX [Clostridiales bacterium]